MNTEILQFSYSSNKPIIEIGEKQFLIVGSRGGQNRPLMHVPL